MDEELQTPHTNTHTLFSRKQGPNGLNPVFNSKRGDKEEDEEESITKLICDSARERFDGSFFRSVDPSSALLLLLLLLLFRWIDGWGDNIHIYLSAECVDLVGTVGSGLENIGEYRRINFPGFNLLGLVRLPACPSALLPDSDKEWPTIHRGRQRLVLLGPFE